MISALALFASTLTACGKAAFVVSNSEQSQAAPGSITIPPKVDILFAEDDTGSAIQAFDTTKSQLVDFVKSLDGMGWDYHFATVPLTTDRALDQVIASRYDGNWGSSWISPYPGALAQNMTIPSSEFRTPTNYSGFLPYANPSSAAEPAFENIRKTLVNAADESGGYSAPRVLGTGFLRPDALTVIFVMTNGQDTSRVNYCRSQAANNPDVACSYRPPSQGDAGVPLCTSMAQTSDTRYQFSCDSQALSMNFYAQQFANLHGSPSQTQMYATIYDSNNANFAPTRYIQMAQSLNGGYFNMFNSSLSASLTWLQNSLIAQKLLYRIRYLFVAQEPELSSIVVTKYHNGQAQVIPRDPNNGWSYDGYVTNVYTIDYPIMMTQASGWAIQLHGSAKLVGDDTAKVDSLPKGSQNSSG